MKNKMKSDDTKKARFDNKETEFVINNSPDDLPMASNGDEKSLIKVDNPDDMDADFRN